MAWIDDLSRTLITASGLHSTNSYAVEPFADAIYFLNSSNGIEKYVIVDAALSDHYNPILSLSAFGLTPNGDCLTGAGDGRIHIVIQNGTSIDLYAFGYSETAGLPPTLVSSGIVANAGAYYNTSFGSNKAYVMTWNPPGAARIIEQGLFSTIIAFGVNPSGLTINGAPRAIQGQGVDFGHIFWSALFTAGAYFVSTSETGTVFTSVSFTSLLSTLSSFVGETVTWVAPVCRSDPVLGGVWAEYESSSGGGLVHMNKSLSPTDYRTRADLPNLMPASSSVSMQRIEFNSSDSTIGIGAVRGGFTNELYLYTGLVGEVIFPLRQRQRDDFWNAPRIRGAGRGNPTSRQASNRAGHRNTYL